MFPPHSANDISHEAIGKGGSEQLLNRYYSPGAFLYVLSPLILTNAKQIVILQIKNESFRDTK